MLDGNVCGDSLTRKLGICIGKATLFVTLLFSQKMGSSADLEVVVVVMMC